jgi:AMP-binding enzyme
MASKVMTLDHPPRSTAPSLPGVAGIAPASEAGTFPMQLAFFLRRAVARFPDDSALVFGNQTLSYLEFDRRAQRLALNLIASGVSPGDRVALHMHNSPDLSFPTARKGRGRAALVHRNNSYDPVEHHSDEPGQGDVTRWILHGYGRDEHHLVNIAAQGVAISEKTEGPSPTLPLV